MKICVTSDGETLDARVDQRFGRCRYFLFIDPETMDCEAVFNQNADGMGGVGIQSGQFVAEKQAAVVLTGHVGPNASQTLEAAGIAVVLNISGTVREAVESFKRGELKSSKGPNTQEKSGMNR